MWWDFGNFEGGGVYRGYEYFVGYSRSILSLRVKRFAMRFYPLVEHERLFGRHGLFISRISY